MAEGYEPYHVPQQSRRDKLRILSQTQNPSLENNFQPQAQFSGFIPLCDPSLLTPDLLACPGNTHLPAYKVNPNLNPDHNQSCAAKDEGHVSNFIGFVGGIGNVSSSSSINGGHGEMLVFKPEPLSLSLSSHDAHQNSLTVEINLHRFGSGACGYELVPCVVDGGGGSCSAAPRSSVPFDSFMGYASILKGSRFLKPAQQILEEFCNANRRFYAGRIKGEDSSPLLDPTVESLAVSCGIADGGAGESRGKKSKLISMLDEVYKRYKQYCQQLQAAVASMECVDGLGNAAPFASLALKTLSKHFKCLKIAITDQLQFADNKTHVIAPEEVEDPGFSSDRRSLYNSSHTPGFSEHHPPVWRPQRGLPEHAVTVLRAWLFDHFLHPYPTDMDKLMLAKQTGLSRNQVSNWFINARVRLWKPMVEEIHMLETRQAQQAASQRDDQPDIPNRSNDSFPENLSTSTQRGTQKTVHEDTVNYFYSSNQQINVGSNLPGLGSSRRNGVSLTLGLHQNNGIGLSEPFPINAAQRFGLGGEGYCNGWF